MENISLQYGKNTVSFEFFFNDCQIILPKSSKPELPVHEILKNAFRSPIGYNYPENLSYNEKNIAIAINDQTRSLPHFEMLPVLLDHLINHGAKPEKITFFIATGTHRLLNDDEITSVLPGDLHNAYSTICHNCDDSNNLLYLGNTKIRNTPVYVNKHFYEADVKIVVGNIEPHHFMGYSGGMKTAAIGLTGRETIQKNHALLTDPLSKMGLFHENSMRQEVEEIGKILEVDYAYNVVLNTSKEIIAAFWGDPYSVMIAGIPIARKSCEIDLHKSECQFDLVIASAGGYPRDINLYQAQKALTHACLFSKKDGVIILLAACSDGAGNEKFKTFIKDKKTPDQIIEEFQKIPFEVGPHKAFQIAQQVKDHTIILVSEMPQDEVREYLLIPANNMQNAKEIAAGFLPQDPRVAILPYATHTMPEIGA